MNSALNHKPYLRVEGLHLVNAAQQMVVRDLSFSIQKGGWLVLTGEGNGGMSAVTQAAAGLLPKAGLSLSAGEVFLAEDNLAVLSRSRLRRIRRRRMAYFDRQAEQRLNPLSTIREHLREAVRWKPKRERDLGQSMIQGLYDVGIVEPERVMDALPDELNSELRCRVRICMALQAGADFIVVNEMTANLDTTVEQQVIDLLVKLKNDQALTLLSVTQDPRIIKAVADEVLVMFEGEEIAQGDPREVYFASANPYIKSLIRCAPRLGAEELRLGQISEDDRQIAKKILKGRGEVDSS